MKKQFKNNAMKKSIDNTVYTLMKRGIYPSSGKVEEIIGKGKYQDY
ncbi:hypothetical protein [Lysinibacillus xylanilyticus]|nr:hypothetical protein [Lysinibacillus xylanilyticus]